MFTTFYNPEAVVAPPHRVLRMANSRRVNQFAAVVFDGLRHLFAGLGALAGRTKPARAKYLVYNLKDEVYYLKYVVYNLIDVVYYLIDGVH